MTASIEKRNDITGLPTMFYVVGDVGGVPHDCSVLVELAQSPEDFAAQLIQVGRNIQTAWRRASQPGYRSVANLALAACETEPAPTTEEPGRHPAIADDFDAIRERIREMNGGRP